MGLKLVLNRNFPPVSDFRIREPEFSMSESAWFIFHPQYYWQVLVEFDPQRGTAPRTPDGNELWQIGIVQNLLFGRVFIRYENLNPIQVTWDRPVVDAVDVKNLPFFAPATVVKLRIRRAEGLPDKEIAVSFQPVQPVFYGPKGIGYLLPAVPLVFVPLDSPIQVCFEDAPSIGLPYRMGGKPLKQAEHLSVFQFWVVAQSPRREPFVLGSSPPFTLVSWAKFLQPGLKALPPSPDWGAFAANGILRTVQYLKKSPNEKPLQPRPGIVDRKPVLTGPTANDRGIQWMKDNGLITR